MRTTVRLDDDLLRRARPSRPGPAERSLPVIEDGLREALARHRRRQRRPPVILPTLKGKGLRPGVDLDDTVGLRDILDGRR
jgi:hypothetical protein